MRCIVIGAAGFIGAALVDHLAACGDHVLAIDHRASDAPSQAARHQTLDVARDDLRFADAPDAVFYLAQSSAYRDFPERAGDLFGVNLVGAVRAASAARAVGAKWFAYASTGNVYQPSFAPLPESAATRRDEPYAASKLMAEEALALFRPRLAVSAIRLFGVFGPRQRRMLPVLVRQRIEQGEPIVLQPAPGEVEPTGGLRVSWTFVGDVVQRLRELAVAATSGQSVPDTLNLAGPEPISLHQFAQTMGRALRREPRFEISATLRMFDLCADITLLRTLTGNTFTPFESAMAAAIESIS
ncbi:MAG: NAD(P)-dependent oxidoreductase [Planctomycetia bacterium]|nr:NAD(P)-dependent oxidoreductase [Planctomycetia bacterium]